MLAPTLLWLLHSVILSGSHSESQRKITSRLSYEDKMVIIVRYARVVCI